MKNLFAFFLASATSTMLCLGFSFLPMSALHHRPIEVTIRSDADTHDVLNAIVALHRQDIDIRTEKSFRGPPSTLIMIFTLPFSLMLMTAIVLAFYKLYCRMLAIPPTI